MNGIQQIENRYVELVTQLAAFHIATGYTEKVRST